MIIGLGNDVIDIRRIERTLERFGARFIERIFTDVEQRKSETLSTVFTLATTNVLFLLAAQPHHVQVVSDALSAVTENWPGQINEVASFPVSGR